MSKLVLYLVGPLTGLLILVIGVLVGLITSSTLDLLAILKIALGVALMTEFAVALSLLERSGAKE